VAGQSPMKTAQAELLRFALGFPEAYEDHPWGEVVAKVKKKVFVFLGIADGALGISVKLPESASIALSLPFVAPTGYGLGKSGWVTARFGPKDRPPMDVLKRWIDESYRAVAPRKLADAAAGASSTAPKPAAAAKRKGIAAAPRATSRRPASRRTAR
jgi:predicted DNA-binding protein (MmcQ/YjbR family)